MKKEQINELFFQFENIRQLIEGVECWSARDVQTILGYSKWDNFIKVISKAIKGAEYSEINISDHFPMTGK